MRQNLILPPLLLAAGALLGPGCAPQANDGPEPRPSDATLVALGDSVLAFHRETDQDIPHVVGEALGRSVYNVSVSGAQLLGGEAPIPAQLPEGPWEWVLIDGGANDMADRCGCGDCDDVLDALITEDGAAGVIPTLAATVASSGARLAIMGYYVLPADAPDFQGCPPWLERLSARESTLADADPAVYFVDASEVMNGDDLELFFPDKVHPSVAGSAVVGEHIARRLQEAD